MLTCQLSLQGTSGSAPEAADLAAALQEHQVTWACVYAFPAGLRGSRHSSSAMHALNRETRTEGEV